MSHSTKTKQDDRALRTLQECDRQLQLWIDESPDNARLFSQDPAAAMEAAHLDLPHDRMLELFQILTSLANKLNPGSPADAAA